jgi:hypothetical protein
MDYTAAADKFEREVDILWITLEQGIDSHEAADLAVAQAKRVRTASTVLVRELARKRDKLQP